MNPTYQHDDWLLFRTLNTNETKSSQRLVGKVVVVERESYPGILLIKRVIRVDKTGIWVEGDNKSASTDSRQWGAVTAPEVIGRVLLRYKRGRAVKP